MTTLTLTKHHGLGNDFLVAFAPPVDDLAAFARRICDRRRGIGADGLLVGDLLVGGGGDAGGGGEAGQDTVGGAPARMALYNADGTPAEMSGNGIRCFAQALAARRGDVPRQVIVIVTAAGPRTVDVVATDDPATVVASVDMGAVENLAAPAGWTELGVHADRPVAHLSLGNPHAVVAVDDVDALDLEALGARVPHVNLEVVAPGPGPDAVTMRVHERGVGITAACGTGACAAAWAAARWGLVPAGTADVVVHMDGGDATVSLHRPVSGRVTLTGPATFVGTIEVPIT